jgi:protease-4
MDNTRKPIPETQPVSSFAGQSSREWKLIENIVNDLVTEQRRSRRWGIFFKLVALLYLILIITVYAAGHPSSWFSKDTASEPFVAVVNLEGTIKADNENNADTIITSLRNAFEAKDSVGVILRINSPGGSPVQSAYISSEMERLRTLHPDKPLYAVITDVGASGGYYVASGAEKIYASPASLVGSIGVTASTFGFVDLMEKMGVERRILTSGGNKAFLDPFSPLKDEEVKFWSGVLGGVHNQFIDQVRKSRGDRLKEDDQPLFTGLIWNGEQAQSLGLIDGFGSVSSIAREHFKTDKLVDFTYQDSALIRMMDRMGVRLGMGFAQSVGIDGGNVAMSLQ